MHKTCSTQPKLRLRYLRMKLMSKILLSLLTYSSYIQFIAYHTIKYINKKMKKWDYRWTSGQYNVNKTRTYLKAGFSNSHYPCNRSSKPHKHQTLMFWIHRSICYYWQQLVNGILYPSCLSFLHRPLNIIQISCECKLSDNPCSCLLNRSQ